MIKNEHHCNGCPHWYVTQKKYPSGFYDITICKKYGKQIYYLAGDNNPTPYPCSACEKEFSYVPYIEQEISQGVVQVTERLSDKNPCNNCRLYNPCTGPCDKWHEWNSSVLSKLAKYETAEEEGRFVVLPCKVGDIVWVIAPNHRICEAKYDCDEYDYENYLSSWCENYCPYGYKGIGVIKDTVSHIEIRNNGICYCTTNCGYLYEDKVFFTREEAEKALKKRRGIN